MRLFIKGSDFMEVMNRRQLVQGSILVFCIYEATKMLHEYQYKNSIQTQDVFLFGFSLLLVLLPLIIKIFDKESKIKKFFLKTKQGFIGSVLGSIGTFATIGFWKDDEDIELTQ